MIERRSALFIAFLLASIAYFALVGKGAEKLNEVQEIVRVTGLSTDTDVQELGELYGFPEGFDSPSPFRLFLIGLRGGPSRVEVVKFLVSRYKVN